MRKLLLVLLAVTVVTSAVPPLRARVAPAVSPVLGPPATYVWDQVRALGTWTVDSIYRWSVKRDVSAITEQLRDHLATGEALPNPSNFSDFLLRNRMAGAIDPWGEPYYLEVGSDSLFVGSAGPDGERGTDDDLIASMSRR